MTPYHYARLKISEGFEQKNSFCMVPDLGNKLVSRAIEDIIAEAEQLANTGVQELLVASQDTCAYGADNQFKTGFYNGRPVKSKLKDLCQALSSFHIWVRLQNIYPYSNVEEIMPLMADGLVLPYLEMPFLHANHDILHAMNRPAHAEGIIHRIAKWRDIAPDVAFRSTFIVGFPGETEAQFKELLDFLSEVRLDRVEAFSHSVTGGEQANQIVNHLPKEVKEERLARLMELQAQISTEILADKIGSIQPVMIDDTIEDDEVKNVALGHTIYDAPEIDGIVQIEDIYGAEPGQIIHVEIIDATDHDLIAVPA